MPRTSVELLLLCAEEAARRFETQLLEIGLDNPVRAVHSADGVAAALDDSTGRRTTALIVVDPEVEGGWEVIRWVKTSRYRRVPLLVICDGEECEDAYSHGANAVMGRARWTHQSDQAASAVGNFWMRVARLPPMPEKQATNAR